MTPHIGFHANAMRFERLHSLAVLSLLTLFAACGGGGGGDSRVIFDVNRDGFITLLAFGDSITRGTGDGPESRSVPPVETAGYPARLQARLNVFVRNAGNPGERTSRGVTRLPSVLSANPDLDHVILLEGINDLNNGDNPSQTIRNLQAMIDQVFGAGALPIIATLTPVCCERTGVVSNLQVSNLNDQIRLLSETNGIPLLDFFEAFGGLLFDPASALLHTPEGLHPTPAGYDLMADFADTFLG